ncbi:FAD-dependent oxidoreductase [Streptomyces sp. NPDC012935]|uniref:FAD-dependent oxidoreductase n=1 Tax=Streptomyces sp. NPDC012935 TaxID=3364857 RepID=UPI003699E3B8
MVDLVVIGAGPAGLAAALAAAARGVRVALVDSAGEAGGSSAGSPRRVSTPGARGSCASVPVHRGDTVRTQERAGHGG